MVSYPGNKRRIGFIKVTKGQLIFTSLDRKYGDMLVHEIKPELYELIKDENEVHAYSYIKRSQVS